MTTPNPLSQLQDPSLLKTGALINGLWLNPGPAHRFAVQDPATGQTLAHVANLGPSHTQQAINAAAAAWAPWKNHTAKDRSIILRQWYQLLLSHKNDLARIITAEQGKPLAEALAEVTYAASFIEWFAEEAKRINGQTLPQFDPNRRLLVIKQPIGVCAAITPWNFPLAMITRKVAPALAAGCPVILKPAEQTPLTALAAGELALRAGLPPGVLNIITGDAQQSIHIGQTLCASPTVRHLSFTGSTEVGRLLMAQSAPTIKKISLELGGNAPFIIFDDAHLPSAIEGAYASKYRNAGQTCVCTNRIYVQDTIYDQFLTQFAAKVQTAKVGNGFDPHTTQGPLIDQAALQKIQHHIQDALALGAQLITGGHPLGGQFFAPTIIAPAHPDMLCASQETFGPLAPIFKFHTEQEVIDAANHTPYGLASYIYSRDIGRIFRVAEALECGMVGINVGTLSTEHAPFGGIKQSGLGREGSQHGIDEYLEIKYLCIGDILQ